MKITREAALKIADFISSRLYVSTGQRGSSTEEHLKEKLNLDIETIRYIVPILLEKIKLSEDMDHKDTYLLSFEDAGTNISFLTAVKRIIKYY